MAIKVFKITMSSSEDDFKNLSKDELHILTALNIVENMLQRNRSVPDPATRALLFVDKLLMVIDVLTGFLKTHSHKYSDPLKNKIDVTSNNLQKELQFITEWILHPQYSPNHPFGESVMHEAAKEFHAKSYDSDEDPREVKKEKKGKK